MEATEGVPDGERGNCRSCGAEIVWTITAKGKRMPLNLDGISHFATCKDAAAWRRR